MAESRVSDRRDELDRLVGFVRALRAAGIPSATATDFIEAVGLLDVGSRADVYRAGRATLCEDPAQLPVYDRVFTRWFGETGVGGRMNAMTVTVERPFGFDAGDDATCDEDNVAEAAALASVRERLAHRDVAVLDARERRELARAFAALPARPPQRRGHRTAPSHRGAIDVGRSAREQLRRGGEPGPLLRHERRSRPRRVVWLIDVSGSMKPYADSYLRLAHRSFQAAPRTTEAFTMGTRLTRITPALRLKDPDRALAAAGELVPDWSGGTRLGDMLRAFGDRWGRRGVARGAVVIIASDGWERGNAQLLGEQVAQLHRLAHRVVWANPHRGKAGYEPIQSGIAAVLPSVDDFVAGHSLATLAEVLDLAGRA
ncbi:VWA domain-containing protein [uncultured Aeromicrobium sp.]|uniref:vWA domain-containing protein n=1 Tax=uncultured Aeromicrobium sp. TaxID=337820 RepID=UPI0025FEC2C4|nr:VWA domain-containing protein [uncultured Aeromicrobium sp.]